MREFFRDERGRLVLWQAPNPPLWLWLASSVGERLLSGRSQQVAGLLAFGALFTWGWLELFEGVTGFRRLLGSVVLIGSVASRTL
jgi:hypothetical protein